MNIIISNADGRPIYEQIYAQLRMFILSGELAPGEPLPSIRALAKDLRISVITTKRAYEELERDGYIYTVAAKGCYVAEQSAALIREKTLRQMEEHIRELLRLAAPCGITLEEIITMVCAIDKEEASP